jgi:exodeoxyribonuclease VII small subunit
MAKRKTAATDPGKLTFEKALEELESIVEAMEEGEVQLADSLEKYERGVKLIKRCRTLLGDAEKRIELLTEEGTAEPLDVEAEDEET